MQVWENHLGVYEATAAAAGRLWDALATHLPIRRMRQLGRVHRAVELMHLTLLQGIADLNDLNMLSRECAARVDRAKQALGDRFDDVLVQRRIGEPASHDLRQSISETGIFAQLAATANSLVQHADQVAERYQDLIDAVKDAFDERRVREGDVIQKAGTVLALSLAFDSVVSLISVAEPQATGSQHAWLSVLVYASVAVVILAAVGLIVWIMRLGRLGDRAFRIRYDGGRSHRRGGRTGGLWQFLKNSSTDALEGHLRDRRDPEFWSRLDDRLAADLAAVWDQSPAVDRPHPRTDSGQYTPPGRPDIVGDDIAALYARVGDWSIHALLFTERARRLYRYPLPKLTLLYRCIARMPASFLHLEHLTTTPCNVVSEAELNRVVRRYARARGASPRGPNDTELGQNLDQHLQLQDPPTAAAALAAINTSLPSATLDQRQPPRRVRQQRPRDTRTQTLSTPRPR
jgi:hypothetical protein